MTSATPPPDRPRRLLVTGGAGFLGRAFLRHWRAAFPDDRLVVLDALTYAADRADCEAVPGITLVVGDVCDRDEVIALLGDEGLDTVVHFAAESHVDRSLDAPEVFVRTNVVGTQAMLDAAVRVWGRDADPARHRFHQVSTDEVYGEHAEGTPPWPEGAPYAPNSPYSASKAAADHLVRAAGRSFGLPVSWSHSCNAYGPGQYPEKLVPIALRRWMDGKPVQVEGDGGQRREWMHADDQVDGIARVIQRGQAGRAYHLGGGTACTNRELLDRLWAACQDALGESGDLAAAFPDRLTPDAAPCVSGYRRPGHDRAYALDGTRARAELGFTPAIGLDAGLAATARATLSAWARSGRPAG